MAAPILLAIFFAVFAVATSVRRAIVVQSDPGVTAVRAFRWRGNVSFPLRDLAEYGRSDLHEGLELMSRRPYRLAKLVNQLIADAKELVKSAERRDTPLYVFSTVSNELHERELNKLIRQVTDLLSDGKRNPFRFSRSNVRVLSLEEEAAMSLLAANQLSADVSSDKSSRKFLDGSLHWNVFGLSIAFEPSSPSVVRGLFPLDLAGTRRVYAHKYLSLTPELVQQEVVNMLLLGEDASTANAILEHPCMLPTDRRSVNTTVYPANNRVSRGPVTLQKVTLVGSGNVELCVGLISSLLLPLSSCAPRPCAIGSTYQPSISGGQRFVASGRISEIAQLFEVDVKDGLSGEDLLEALRRQCSTPDEEYTVTSEDCEDGAFVVAALKALGFNSSARQIRVAESQLSWPIGALSYELANRRGYEPTTYVNYRSAPLRSTDCECQ